MDVYNKIYIVFQVSGLLICLWLSFYALARWRFPAGRASAAMLASICFILFTNTVGWVLNYDLELEFFWIKIGYLGLNTLPVGWFCFALILGGYERWLTRRRVLGLLVVPLIVFVLVMTGAMFEKVHYFVADGVPVRDIVFSGWLLLNYGYSYSLFGFGILLILRALAVAPYLRRYQSGALILATLVPLIFNTIYVTHLLPITQDLTPLTFAFSGIVLSVGLMRYQALDLTPVARSAFMDHTHDGILVVDARGRIADLNSAAQRYLGQALSTVLGRPLIHWLPAVQACLGPGEALRCEIRLTVAGSPVDLEAVATPLYFQNNLLVGRLIVLHDVTARKQTENTLQAALQHERELAEMKTRFYAYFAHQLRTPLSVIVSSTELLEYYGQDWRPEKRSVHFERIYKAVRQLTGLSERAATFEKNEKRLSDVTNTLRLERFNLQEFVGELCDEAQSLDANHHAVTVAAPEPLLPVFQDAALLHDVLENVLSNALKYSPPDSPVLVTLSTTSQEVCVCVEDQGCGIPADELDKVFQPFYRASNVTEIGGMGLGLAICRHYLAHLGGRIQLDSRLNLGTTVQITLPRELPA